MSVSQRSTAARRRLRITAIALLGALALAGCNKHVVALTGPCHAVTVRGAEAMPKIGLTATELKALDKC